MRHASTTISWLAEQKATKAAAAREGIGLAAGSDTASRMAAKTSIGWIIASHPRRCPNRRNGPGGGRSNTGAQRTFSE